MNIVLFESNFGRFCVPSCNVRHTIGHKLTFRNKKKFVLTKTDKKYLCTSNFESFCMPYIILSI